MTEIGTILILLILASVLHHLAKIIKVPYTILLFAVGVILGILIQNLGYESMLGINLTPELLFFVLLPVLIFESGYSIKYRELAHDYIPIWSLALFGVAISSGVIGVVGRWLAGVIGYTIPLPVMLLFGVIISATDPVAVLAIFKNIGVPHRLRLLFEGESLFNDGTALALFLVILQLIQQGTFSANSALYGLVVFFSMVIGGIILGTVNGIIFSRLIKIIKNNELAEITLIMVLAHLTFLSAEFISLRATHYDLPFQISGVIATAYAALIMGNYGRTKITPKVEEYMDRFWQFLAFVCNALIFLLMGLMIREISIPIYDIWPLLLLVIGVVVTARAISVYVPIQLINLFSSCTRIPSQWQHLLAWGSLRGAIAIVMVLLIPKDITLPGWSYDFSVYDLILTMTITVIVFSLLVKGLSIESITKYMNLNKLYDLEEFEQYESEIIVYTQIIKKIKEMQKHYHISQESYEILMEKYKSKIDESRLKMELFLSKQENPSGIITKALCLHALGIEKQYLKEMFHYNEIPENLFHYMNSKIDIQSQRINMGKKQIRGFDKPENMKRKIDLDPILWLLGHLGYTSHSSHDDYIISRTRAIVSNKVIASLKQFAQIDFGYDNSSMQNILKLYEDFHARACGEREQLHLREGLSIDQIDSILLDKGLAKTEEKVITDLLSKEMITDKLYQKFIQEIEDEVMRAY